MKTYENGIRYYHLDGKKYPSVTSILKYYPKGETFYNWLKQNSDKSGEILKNAGIKGTEVHQTIENWLINPSKTHYLTESNKKHLNQFKIWLKCFKNIKIIDIEKELINKQFEYAGTTDLIVELNGELWIIDFKTSKGLYTSHELQLSAYKHCGYNAKLGLLKLNEDSYEFKEVEDKFDLFLAVKKIFDYEVKKI